jgi:hypothetical protein
MDFFGVPARLAINPNIHLSTNPIIRYYFSFATPADVFDDGSTA